MLGYNSFKEIVMNATTFASFNSNFGLTLIGTHEPDVRALSMAVAQTRGMFVLNHEYELVSTYRVLTCDTTDSGWVVTVADDVGTPTILCLEVKWNENGVTHYTMKRVNYKRKWD